jgi:hypothetical protein
LALSDVHQKEIEKRMKETPDVDESQLFSLEGLENVKSRLFDGEIVAKKAMAGNSNFCN